MFVIEKASKEDAAEILSLQKLAYRSEAELNNDENIPPLLQSLAELEMEFLDHVILKLCQNGAIIGSVRAIYKGDTCYIGKLIVHPEHQGRGYGRQLMRAIEAEFPMAKRFELFTGSRSERNLHLYQKLGYSIFAERLLYADLCLKYLEKHNLTAG